MPFSRACKSRDFLATTTKLLQSVGHRTVYTFCKFQGETAKPLEMANVKQSHLRRFGMFQKSYHNIYDITDVLKGV